jgi:hypothetical protein
LQAHHRRVIYLSAATAAHLPADPVAERGDRCKEPLLSTFVKRVRSNPLAGLVFPPRGHVARLSV